jgi:hypothetical protein
VVQEQVELRTEIFPIFSESRWALQPMYVDTNPFLFAGRVEGAMVRLSDSPVVNVTSGGGETGFFVIEGFARREGDCGDRTAPRSSTRKHKRNQRWSINSFVLLVPYCG